MVNTPQSRYRIQKIISIFILRSFYGFSLKMFDYTLYIFESTAIIIKSKQQHRQYLIPKNMERNQSKTIPTRKSIGFQHAISQQFKKKTQFKVTPRLQPDNPPTIHQRPLVSRRNVEFWEKSEISKVFQLYQVHGSRWKILAQYFPDRYQQANSIKNRFYTVLRNLLKDLFYYNSSLPQKLPGEISSKVILKFYEGREEFQSMGSFGKKIMAEIGYSVQSHQTHLLSQKYPSQIEKIYKIIFKSSLKNDDPESQYQNEQELPLFSQSQDQRLSQPRDQRLLQPRDQRLPQPQDELNINSQGNMNGEQPMLNHENEQMAIVSQPRAMGILFYWYPQQYSSNVVFYDQR